MDQRRFFLFPSYTVVSSEVSNVPFVTSGRRFESWGKLSVSEGDWLWDHWECFKNHRCEWRQFCGRTCTDSTPAGSMDNNEPPWMENVIGVIYLVRSLFFYFHARSWTATQDLCRIYFVITGHGFLFGDGTCLTVWWLGFQMRPVLLLEVFLWHLKFTCIFVPAHPSREVRMAVTHRDLASGSY